MVIRPIETRVSYTIKNNGQGNKRPDQHMSYKYIILSNYKQLDLAEIVEVLNLDIVISDDQLGDTAVFSCDPQIQFGA